MIDINTATPDQLREAMSLIATRLAQIEQQAATTEEGLRAQLGSVVSELDKLIGPDNPKVKSAATLTQANLYTAPELNAASGVAHGPTGIHSQISALAFPPTAANTPAPWTLQSIGSSRTRAPARTAPPGSGLGVQCERSPIRRE